MRCGVVIAALAAAGLALAADVSTQGGPPTWLLLDGPRGGWLASVRADAPMVVLEERDGWRRVRIEGWVASSFGSPPPTVTPAMPGARATIEGTLAGPGEEAAGVVTRVVLLVTDLADLDRKHGALGAECRPPIEAAEEKIRALEMEAGRALGSSDNFRTAAEAKDKARAAAQKARSEREERVATCRVRAEELFRSHALQTGFADSSGRFRFIDVPPGSYRVIAYDTKGDLTRAMALDCRVQGGDGVRLDAGAHRSSFQPFWGLRPSDSPR